MNKYVDKVNDNIIKNHLASISKIQSQILNKEFLNVLANSNLQDQENANNIIYYIVKKLYEIEKDRNGKASDKVNDLLKLLNWCCELWMYPKIEKEIWKT